MYAVVNVIKTIVLCLDTGRGIDSGFGTHFHNLGGSPSSRPWPAPV